MELEGLFGYLDPELLLNRKKRSLRSIQSIQLFQLFRSSRVGPVLGQPELLAQTDLLHPTSSELLKKVNLLLLDPLDVTSQGVASIAKTDPLRSGEGDIAMR